MTDETSRRVAVERLYAALAVGDGDAVLGALTPDFVGRTANGLPLGLGGTHRGAEAMRDFWWNLGAAFRVRPEPEAFAGIGTDGLQVTGTYRGTARRTGRAVEAAYVHLFTFDGDRISGLTQLTDTAPWVAALEGAERAAAPSHPGVNSADLETIDYSVVDSVARVFLNRPEARNAIDLRMGDETLVVARAIAADARVRAVLIAGHGPAFTVGGDIEYFAEAPVGSFGEVAGRMTDPFHEAFRILSRIDAPIVTAVHGAAAGGGLGFLYAADVSIAAEGTVFSTAFSGIGLSGDGGGTWHLPRMIGAGRARRMYVENLRVDAATALDWGLVSEVVPQAELLERATAVASRLAAGPTKAYGRQRRLLRDTWSTSLSDQLRLESEGIVSTGGTADADRAIAAFLSKRRPTFEGR